MAAELTTALEQFAVQFEAIMSWVGPLFILLVFVGFFAVSPFSNILNVITVPLGYEWQSCPNCPAVGIEKIEWAECATCGRRHRTNFGAAKYRDGNEWRFCDSDCLEAFTPGGEVGR